MKLSPTAHRILADRYNYLEWLCIILLFAESGWRLLGVAVLYAITIVVDRKTYASWREAYDAKRNPVDKTGSQA